MRLVLLILLVACDDKKSVNDYLVRSATKIARFDAACPDRK